MKEEVGNLWEYHALGEWVAITTNPIVNMHDQLVMGRGTALQAARRFPGLRERLADMVLENGNHVVMLPDLRLFTFPVKHHWKEKADLALIKQSAYELVELADFTTPRVYVPRPGCGNGGLEWRDVRPILGTILDDRFVIVDRQLSLYGNEHP